MNKDHELIIVKSFRDNYKEFPKGRISESETPDFIIASGPKAKTGIELVQLLPPPEHHYAMAGILKPKYAYEQLLMTIILKENKRRSYSNPALMAIWLIIHFDYLDGADSFNLNNQIDKWHFSNGFDRVFLYDLFTNNIYECCQKSN